MEEFCQSWASYSTTETTLWCQGKTLSAVLYKANLASMRFMN